MINHIDLGETALERIVAVNSLIRKREITLAGHRKAKIYDLLSCASGKRIRVERRVFFKSEDEALKEGFRPCGHCMIEKFNQWKESKNNN